MKFNKIIPVLLIAALTACGGNKQQSGETSAGQTEMTEEEAQIKSSAETMIEHPGKEVYDAVCLACHMADGSGVPGMHPPLANTEWVTGDKERLIKIVLQGMSGKIEVNGKTYNSIMPPNSHLTDRQIANVLSYVRSSFGNDASPVSPDEVKEVRKSIQN